MHEAPIDGAKVKHLRIARRLRAVEFARMVGISTEWLRQIEKLDQDPSDVVKGKIADALGVPVEFLLRDRTDHGSAA